MTKKSEYDPMCNLCLPPKNYVPTRHAYVLFYHESLKAPRAQSSSHDAFVFHWKVTRERLVSRKQSSLNARLCAFLWGGGWLGRWRPTVQIDSPLIHIYRLYKALTGGFAVLFGPSLQVSRPVFGK